MFFTEREILILFNQTQIFTVKIYALRVPSLLVNHTITFYITFSLNVWLYPVWLILIHLLIP